MTLQEKIVLRLFLFCILLTPFVIGIHYAVFPEETKCILVDWTNLENKDRIYYSEISSEKEIDSLQVLIDSAALRVANFWGEKTCNPKYIYLKDKTDYAGYCPSGAPAATYLKLGSYIVLSSDAVNIDIIAHEISHAEFFERIGFSRWTYDIPSWFKHGLAMQNDYREGYSEEQLKLVTKDMQDIPEIKDFIYDLAFYSGTEEEVALHYMLAKQEVKKWYSPQKLKQLIADLNASKKFKDAFGYDAGIIQK